VTRNRARQGNRQIERRNWRNHQTKARERQHRRAHFNDRQRTRIRSYYRGHRHHFHRVARVSWPIVIGSFVPRDYTVYDIPSDFYGYVPGYEGYKYVVVGDQLIIIDPDTWEIVAIIPL
jgi:Ni/Co efflux regulator RcnB